MSTGFDELSLRFLLDRFEMPGVKIPSGEVVNARLLLEAARSGRHVFLSTGMCTMADIERARRHYVPGIQNREGGPRADSSSACALAASRELRERVTPCIATTE